MVLLVKDANIQGKWVITRMVSELPSHRSVHQLSDRSTYRAADMMDWHLSLLLGSGEKRQPLDQERGSVSLNIIASNSCLFVVELLLTCIDFWLVYVCVRSACGILAFYDGLPAGGGVIVVYDPWWIMRTVVSWYPPCPFSYIFAREWVYIVFFLESVVFTGCCWQVRVVFTGYCWQVRMVFTGCYWQVRMVFTGCCWQVRVVFTGCCWQVRVVFTGCCWQVRVVFTGCCVVGR